VCWTIITSILVASVTLSNIRADNIQIRSTQAPIFSVFINDFKSYFREHPQQCFAGIKNNSYITSKTAVNTAQNVSSNISESNMQTNNLLKDKTQLNMILYYYSCGYRKSSHPIYLDVSYDVRTKKYTFNSIEELWSAEKEYQEIPLNKSTSPPIINIHQLASTKKSIGSIWWSAPHHLSELIHVENCTTTSDIKFSEARIFFASSDKFPTFYNFSILIKNQHEKNYLITFRSNVVELTEVDKEQHYSVTIEKLTTAKTFLEAMTWTSELTNIDSLYLNSVPKEFLVRFKKSVYGTEIYFQKQFIGMLPIGQNEQSTNFYICPFDNKTAHEEVVSFAYVKH
jgi:hypothetical protein